MFNSCTDYGSCTVFNKVTSAEIKKQQLRDRIIRTRRYGRCFKEMVILRSGIVIYRYRGDNKNHDEHVSEY